MRKNILYCSSVILALSGYATSANRPNVVLIVVDDLGWTDLSCYGSDLYQTPAIDRMAKEGVRFTNGYAACTVSSPTRAAIMTGKYPARLHCTDWIAGHKKPHAKLKVPDWTQFMSHDEYTLAEALADNGYTTLHVGKWHLGEGEKYWPENHGFSVNIGGWDVGAPQKKNGGNGYFPPYRNPRLSDGPEEEYLTERLTDEVLNLLEKHSKAGQPVFLNMWFYNVHTPLQAKKEKVEKYKKTTNPGAKHRNPVYAAMVEHVDNAVERILAKLVELKIDDNTLVIFTSDNGGLVGNFENNRQHVTSNFPLRSGKGDRYEGGVRVPFIVKLPGINKGRVDDTPVISTDIYPTILGFTGIRSSSLVDGTDLTSLLKKRIPLQRKAIYWHYPHYHLEGAVPYSAIRKGDWKLIYTYEDDQIELYNLKKDIAESQNLIKRNPEKAKELFNDLNNWKASVNAQMPVENPGFIPELEKKWSFELKQSAK
ncbi:MAG: sulfatase [Paludibacter sp.]|jgi:arylsulfatase A-like enzyme|nr:sulfatase [Paludibacter sp.]